MNQQVIEKIANAVLYEGYMLYPDRTSSTRNRHRFNFGVLYPEGFDTSSQRTECLVHDDGHALLDVTIRYLRLDPEEHAHERDVEIPDLRLHDLVKEWREETFEPGAVRISAQRVERHCYRLAIDIHNVARIPRDAPRERALAESMISVHTILVVHGGSFPSLLDPPEALREAAAECHNSGTWPVLAGDEGSHDAMLSSPVILSDYPRLTPESPGNPFDGTESDERGRRVLERTGKMPRE